MKPFWIALALLAAVSAGAPAQGLPPEVAEPYQAYEAAVAGGDIVAARASAARAYEAGQAAELSGSVLGLLAENYAFVLGHVGEFEPAAAHWEQAAEHGAADGAAPLDTAWRWHNAALNANRAGNARVARRHAASALEQIHLADPATADDLNLAGEIHFLAASQAGERGNFRTARELIAQTLDLFARAEREPDANYAMAHYFAGLLSVADRSMTFATYHFHMAQDIADYSVRDDRLAMVAAALRGFAASHSEYPDEADAPTPEAMLEADALHAARYAGLEDDTAEPEDRGETFVDAAPLHRTTPSYPERAQRDGYEGVTVVRFDVNERGETANIELIAGLPSGAFDAATIDAVEQWRYEPATLDGVPTLREGVTTYFFFQFGEPESRRPSRPSRSARRLEY